MSQEPSLTVALDIVMSVAASPSNTFVTFVVGYIQKFVPQNWKRADYP